MVSGKSEHCRWRVEVRCELLPWLISLPLGLSRKRAKDLLRFRAVHVQKEPLARDGSAAGTDDAAPASQRCRAAGALETNEAAAARRRDRPIEKQPRGHKGAAVETREAAAARGRDRPINVRHDTVLEPGDVVTIEFSGQAKEFETGPGAVSVGRGRVAIGRRGVAVGRGGVKTSQLGLKMVYLDDAIVVIDKPAGLLSMGSEREKEKTAHRILNDHLKEEAKSREQQAFIVHRLDRETSGLMLFARNLSMQAALQQNWKAVTKRYLAVVEGALSKPQGTLSDRLVESKSLLVHRVEQGGEIAITHYRVVEAGRDRSLVELTLETGRKHQIRVQLAGLGNPVVGDRKYGARTDPARRLALHSCELRFRHPVSGAPMEFRSALPARLRQLLEPGRSGRST
jgi:23S rRNA pseudouridine1911/1915/1917 synthase